MDEEVCDFCGEVIQTVEVGEFWDPEAKTSLYGHAQCGLDRNLPIA